MEMIFIFGVAFAALVGIGLAIYGFVCLLGRGRSAPLKSAASRGQSPSKNPPETTDNGSEVLPSGVSKFEDSPKKSQMMFTSAMMVRCLVIVGITIGLLLPLGYFSTVVDERADLYSNAIANISEGWGKKQTISGPILVVPYESWRTVLEEDPEDFQKKIKRDEKYISYKIVLPKKVDFSADLTPQTLYRGIYHYVVYFAPISVKGSFDLPSEENFSPRLERVFWEQAFFSLGVSDLAAVKSNNPLLWNQEPAGGFEPGTNVKDLLGPGFHSRVRLQKEQRQYNFALDIEINGSGGIFFTPVGETTEIFISGNWPAPSFDGNLLPNKREISREGFKATWSIPHLSRTYPQAGVLGDYQYKNTSAITSFTAGVNLYETVSLYRQVTRAVKYGILFIGLTFVAIFSFELVTRSRMHLIQYGFVGIAMCLFYLVLLSLAEHISFWQAFIAASLVSIIMNGLYITAAMRSKTKGATITLLLACLYVILYVILQLEDYALLVGTILVLVVVGVLMYLTRNLNIINESKAIDTNLSA